MTKFDTAQPLYKLIPRESVSLCAFPEECNQRKLTPWEYVCKAAVLFQILTRQSFSKSDRIKPAVLERLRMTSLVPVGEFFLHSRFPLNQRHGLIVGRQTLNRRQGELASRLLDRASPGLNEKYKQRRRRLVSWETDPESTSGGSSR